MWNASPLSAEGVHDGGGAQAGRYGEAPGEPFSDADEVGLDALLLEAEPRAGSAAAGVDLVEDDHRTGPVGGLDERLGQPAGAPDTAPALDRLDEDGADVVQRRERPQGARVTWAPVCPLKGAWKASRL